MLLFECDLTCTIFKFEKNTDDYFFYSGCFGETITRKGYHCLQINCSVEADVNIFKISRYT